MKFAQGVRENSQIQLQTFSSVTAKDAIEIDGYAGFLGGKINPYEPGTPENDAWSRGYWEASRLES